MQRSAERFLTTHVGSLPRPNDIVRSMFAKEDGVPLDDEDAGRELDKSGQIDVGARGRRARSATAAPIVYQQFRVRMDHR